MCDEHVPFPSSRNDEHIKHDIVENDELGLNAQIVVKCELDDCFHDSSSVSSVGKHDLEFFNAIEQDEEIIFPSTLHSTCACSCEGEMSCDICTEIDNWLSTSHDLDSSSSSIDNIKVHATLDESLDMCAYFDPSELHVLGSPIKKDSMILKDKIVNENESFHLVLSCDLPPDIKNVNTCFEILGGNSLINSLSSSILLPPNSCDCKSDVMYSNIKLDSAFSPLQAQEDFEIVTTCLVPTEGNQIDFLGCHSYLESSVFNMFVQYSRPLHVYIFGLGTASGLSSLQAYNWKDPLQYQPPPYFLGPFPIEPEPPPPKKIKQREVCTMKTIMFLILDENFSFKFLKRF